MQRRVFLTVIERTARVSQKKHIGRCVRDDDKMENTHIGGEQDIIVDAQQSVKGLTYRFGKVTESKLLWWWCFGYP